MDVDSASMMDACCTHPLEDLNTSDHLPLSVSMSYGASTCSEDKSAFPKQIDWAEARKNGSLEAFSTDQTRTLLHGSI